MKHIILITCILSLLFFACEPTFRTSYYLNNQTIDTIEVNLYSDTTFSKKSIVLPKKDVILFDFGGIGSSEPAILTFDSYDSIFVSKKNGIIKYYRDSATNQIYKMDNWILRKNSKYNYAYTFEFNESDFK